MAEPFHQVAELRVDPARTRVAEQGWQSWTPSASYAVGEPPWRPLTANIATVAYRPDHPAPAGGFRGDGLLALDPGTGEPTRVWAASDPTLQVATLHLTVQAGLARVSADGPVSETWHDPTGGLQAALAGWAERCASTLSVGPLRPAPTIWCSWYQYFTTVTEDDIVENLDWMDRLELPVEVVQIDDGYQAEIGDWLSPSRRFSSLAELAGRIRDRGRRAGIWVAPFLVGANSQVAREHPDWLVGEARAGHHWGQDLHVLDVTRPAAAEYLARVLGHFRALGIDFFKIDFVYAGALRGRRHEDLPPVVAYRRGLQLIRQAIGGQAYLLGCGAPLLPSIGLVDSMRVSPDVGLTYQPTSGDMSGPSQRAAVLTGRSRAFQHGRFWVNDPDCLIARPGMERREEWAAYVERYGGLRGSGDRLAGLDDWGLSTTRRLLAERPPLSPFVPAAAVQRPPAAPATAPLAAAPSILAAPATEPPKVDPEPAGRTRPDDPGPDQ